jgi:hypothetical protein
MLESIVDLLNGLFLIAVIVLMVSSIVGSMVAAVRAVSAATAPTSSQGKFADDAGEGRKASSPLNLGCELPTAFSNSMGGGENPISPRKAELISPARKKKAA